MKVSNIEQSKDKVLESAKTIIVSIEASDKPTTELFRSHFYGPLLLTVLKNIGVIGRTRNGILFVKEEFVDAQSWISVSVKIWEAFKEKYEQYNSQSKATKGKVKELELEIAELKEQISLLSAGNLKEVTNRAMVEELSSRGYEVKVWELVRKEVELS